MIFSASGQKMEGFQGRKFFAREPSASPPPRVSARSRAEKLPLYFFLIFARAVFLILKEKGNFSARQAAASRLRRGFGGQVRVADGGWSVQVSFFGFVYQIW